MTLLLNKYPPYTLFSYQPPLCKVRWHALRDGGIVKKTIKNLRHTPLTRYAKAPQKGEPLLSKLRFIAKPPSPREVARQSRDGGSPL